MSLVSKYYYLPLLMNIPCPISSLLEDIIVTSLLYNLLIHNDNDLFNMYTISKFSCLQITHILYNTLNVPQINHTQLTLALKHMYQ